MTTENKELENNKKIVKQTTGEKTLKLKDLQNFTVGEIVEKSKRVDEENDLNESILDKYIRQHRSEIEEAKNKGLENYILSERSKLNSQQSEVSKIENFADENSKVIEHTAESSATEALAGVKSNPIQTEEPDSVENLAEQESENEGGAASDLEKEIQSKSPQIDEATVVGQGEIDQNQSVNHENKGAEIDETLFPEIQAAPANQHEAEHMVARFEDDVLPVENEEENATDTSSTAEESQENGTKIQPKTNPDFDQVTIGTVPELTAESNENSDNKMGNSDIVKGERSKKDSVSEPENNESAQRVTGHEMTEKTLNADEKHVNFDPVIAAENESQSQKKSRKTPIIIGVCAVLLLAAGGAYYASQNAAQKTIPVKTSQSSSKLSALAQFNKDYDEYYLDSDHSVLRNSKFGQLTNLSKDLDKISSNKEKQAAKSKYETLKSEIDAINLINGLFDSAVINDGKIVSGATLKSGVALPSLPKTTNSKLNNLLKQALEEAKTQKAASTKSVSSSQAAKTAVVSPSSSTSSTAKSSTAQSASRKPSTSSPTTNANVTVDNSLARVKPQANLNTSDPAFTWAAGIKDKVLNKCRTRGYIKGNDYILIPVAIHTTIGNGSPAGIRSGYYNLYDPSGRYLLTINCKTGYFFGNGSQHPLDF